MALNRNNFLRWSGAFNEAPHSVTAVNDALSVPQKTESVMIYPLMNDSATFGVDMNTLVITQQDNLLNPAVYNTVTGAITYYPPENAPTGPRTLKYTFKDLVGNVSNEATITVTLVGRLTAWRGYAPSYHCEKDLEDENTGYAVYDTLEEYYPDDNTPVTPASTKPNSSLDPNYIPAQINSALCPINKAYFSILLIPPSGAAATMEIDSVILYTPGNPSDVKYTFDDGVTDGQKTYNIKTGIYGMKVHIKDIWAGTNTNAFIVVNGATPTGSTYHCEEMTAPGGGVVDKEISFDPFNVEIINASVGVMVTSAPC